MIKDLTQGNERKTLFLFCIPIFLSFVCQQCYNLFDGIVVGKMISADPLVSEQAVSAVGISQPVTLIFLAVATGASLGLTVFISQLFGAKEYAGIRTGITTAFSFFAAVGVLLTVGGLLFSGKILDWLNTPEAIRADAGAYLDIYIAGILFIIVYNLSSGVFQALGDSVTPLCLLAGSSVLNILLDILFVKAFGFGVPGVAWATLIAQGAAAIVCTVLVVRRLRGFPAGKLFSGCALKKLLYLAVPGMLQQLFVAVGNTMIQSLVDTYDTAVISGFSSALKLNTLAVSAYLTVSNGLSSFVAQNTGAGKTDRVERGIRSAWLLMIFLLVPVVLVFLIFAPQILKLLFLSEDSAEAVKVGSDFLRTAAPFYFVISVKIVYDGFFRGTGRMHLFMISTVADLILRVGFTFLLEPWCGIDSVRYAWVIGWTITAVMVVFLYLSVRKREKKQVKSA